MKYTVDHFIQKFEKIPEENWMEGEYKYGNRCCAMGHCGAVTANDLTAESRALESMLGGHYVVQTINDNHDLRYQQPTPKQRILAALYDIKSMQKKDIDTGGKKERIVYVSVPVSITAQAKELVVN